MPGAPSLWQPFDREATRTDLLVVWDGAGYTTWSWDDWRARALRFAAGLHALGARPGERVGCLLTNSPDACAAVLGVWLAGCSLVSLPSPARGMDASRYALQLRAMTAQSQPTLVAADPGAASLLADLDVGPPVVAFDGIDAPQATEPEPPAGRAEALVQYSSGSTSEPRGCVLSADAIAWQLASLERALEIDPGLDTGVCWLPMSHDMGLFGCVLLTYWTGHRLVLGTPQRFMADPGSWWRDCAEYRATVAATPGFGLDVATRVAQRRPPPPFPMRRLIVGGDHVDAATLDRATRTLGRERLPRSALLPAYGLAEAVLAVTITPVGEGPTTVEVDADALAAGTIEPGGDAPRPVTLTAAGRVLPGSSLEIGGRVGEVRVTSPSLADGYLDLPVATAERFTAHGLRTRDVGFVLDDRLYVAGRLDDLVCVAGRNVYTRDIERALGESTPVRRGACAIVAAGERASGRLVAVAELAPGGPSAAATARRMARVALEVAGVRIDECVFVARGSLPKTPSGKLQRFRCRDLAERGAECEQARVAL